jgi:hypothetical protein
VNHFFTDLGILKIRLATTFRIAATGGSLALSLALVLSRRRALG